MQIGRLKDKIGIYQRTETRTDTGAVDFVWQNLTTLPAAVVYKTGNKAQEENVMFNVQYLEITIRYNTTVNENMRVLWDGKWFKINFVNPAYNRTALLLNVERLKENEL